MAIPDIFTPAVTEEIIRRINSLTPATPAKWGKMNVGQMLAHCSVTYEMLYENKHKKPNVFMRFILKKLVKKTVVGEGVYKKNSPTASAFKMTEEKVFETEKKRLIEYIERTQKIGGAALDNKESLSFGPLTTNEWNNMFYKHLDHHLAQFGA
jgi:Protein of unknown function (DUF1569)